MTATQTPAPNWSQRLIDLSALSVALKRQRPQTPAGLARRIIRDYRITPTSALIGYEVAKAIRTPNGRLILCAPPRESKTLTAAIAGTVWALQRDPDCRVILTSYADKLPHESSHDARKLVSEHHATLGFSLSQDRAAVGRWRVADHAGGLLAAGLMSGLYGFGADCLILDDITKNAAEASSEPVRKRTLDEFRSTVLSRVHAGGACIVLGTRWSPFDLIGTLLAEESDRWRYVNVPALAEPQNGIPDALGRPQGQAMTSALGQTSTGFAEIRRSLGSRRFYALYQGMPSTPEGGLCKLVWIEATRLPCAPSNPRMTVVGVDPAEGGGRGGDDTGIVACSMTTDGTVAIIADKSGQFTSAQWARVAIELAIDCQASEIAIEAFAARQTYVQIVKDAMSRYQLPHAIRVSGWPPVGSGRGKGSDVDRAAALLVGLETGTVKVAGFLPDFEDAATSWEAGDHCPDSLSAAIVAHDVLEHSKGRQCSLGVPYDATDPKQVGYLRDWLSQKIG
ncbi:terminase large subunit domain-containing protein [Mycobacterium sp.]|uniref:terminase large subunit domain-containing protein n=1 Tax=Mycobacterium sp. TaxID=1785 RepID=UPI003F981BAB